MLDLDKEPTAYGPSPIISITRVVCLNPGCGKGSMRLRFVYPDHSGTIYSCLRCGLFDMQEPPAPEESPGGTE